MLCIDKSCDTASFLYLSNRMQGNGRPVSYTHLDYGMMLCFFDSGGGIETVSSGADVTFNQIKPIGSNRFNLYSSTYDTALSATFQICLRNGRHTVYILRFQIFIHLAEITFIGNFRIL